MVKDTSGRLPMRPSRPLSATDVRSVVFTTTRMRLGYDVEEVDAFLDQVEWSVEQMLGEIQRLRQQLNESALHSEAQTYDLRVALEQLLMRIGGPTGRIDPGLIDPSGRLVSPFEGYRPAPGPQPQGAPGPQGAPQPAASQPPLAQATGGAPNAGYQPPAGFGPPPGPPTPNQPPPTGAPSAGPPPRGVAPAPSGPAVDLPPPGVG